MRGHFASWDAEAEIPAAQVLGLSELNALFGPRLSQMQRTPLFGLELLKGNRGEVAAELVAMAAAGECATIQFINAHCVNVLENDPAYRRALEAADYLLPDGSGLAIAAQLAGVEMGENLNGTDLFPEICRNAAATELPIYLLGGRPGVAAGAARAMRSMFPELTVAGTRHGFWKHDSAEEDALIEEINESGAAILFVGMGVPMQEKWIARVRHRLTARVVLGVGGLFDYYSGMVARAPMLMRMVGCEWAWRLLLEPRRLFVRYVLGNPRFIARAITHAMHAREVAGRISLSIKHQFDRAMAGFALMVFSPVFLAVALAIKLEDGGPVFFRQTRIGAFGKPFAMWKFRSMVVDAEARLTQIAGQSERQGNFKMKRDPRVTRVGALLRRLSLDELPQLINIVRGEMSVVGPRPALPREVVHYDETTRKRLAGLPGLTCTWQVSGRADIPFDQQVELDVNYLKKRTLLGDLTLIVKTIPAVITARGAY